MTVLVGPVLDALGQAQRRELHQPDSIPVGPASIGRMLPPPELRTRSWSTPSVELRRSQPPSWLNIGHDPGRTLGPVIWLELDRAARAWAICTTDLDVPTDRDWYYSAETTSDRTTGGDVELTGIGLVQRSAQIGLRPVTVLPGELDDYRHRDKRRHLTGPAGEILTHAAEHHEHHRHAGATTLTVHDMRPPEPLEHGMGWIGPDGERIPASTRAGAIAHDDDGKPLGHLWYRPSQILSVRGRPVRPR